MFENSREEGPLVGRGLWDGEDVGVIFDNEGPWVSFSDPDEDSELDGGVVIIGGFGESE